jgi:hypothetical protein
MKQCLCRLACWMHGYYSREAQSKLCSTYSPSFHYCPLQSPRPFQSLPNTYLLPVEMKLSVSPLSLVAMSTVFTLATAHFDIYYAEYNPKPANAKYLQRGFMLLDDDPANCTAIENSPFIPLKNKLIKDQMAITCQSEMGCVFNDTSFPPSRASKQAS